MKEGLRREKTITGIKWSMLSQILVQGSNILISILLTRLLTPDDFGLIAMITVFTGFLAVYQDFGLGAALIYKKNVSELDYNTVFYTHLFLGFVLAIVLFVSSGFIADFYNNDILKPLVMVISLNFVIQSFSYIQYTILKKKLDFKSIFYVDVLSVGISGLVAIYLAYIGYGVWSIVIKLIVLELLRSSLLWFLGSWSPKLKFSKLSLKESLDYSLPVAGTQTIGYFMRNFDNLLIGKMLGSIALGFYSRAYSLMMLPVSQVGSVLVNVLFPSFSQINDDIELFKSHWLRINSFLSLFVFPICALIFIMSESFVNVVLGEEWIEIILIIKILSFAGVAQSLTNVSYLFNSLGKTKLNFKINLVINLLLITAIVIGINFGIIGVSISYAVSTVLFIPFIRWYYIGKLINTNFFQIFSTFKSYLFFSIVSTFIIIFIDAQLNLKYIYQLFFYPIIFMTIYLTCLWLFKDRSFLDLKQIILNKF